MWLESDNDELVLLFFFPLSLTRSLFWFLFVFETEVDIINFGMFELLFLISILFPLDIFLLA